MLCVVCLVLMLFLQCVQGQPEACDILLAPATCTCWQQYGKKDVSCNNVSLTTIPRLTDNSIHLELDKLELSHNSITMVQLKDMTGMLIRHIDLSHNQISTIEENAFAYTESVLETLHLSHNLLHDFSYTWSSGAVLKELHLTLNQITDLPALLEKIPGSLINLQLANNPLMPFNLARSDKINKLVSLSLGPVKELKFSDVFKTPNVNLKLLTITGSKISLDPNNVQELSMLGSLTELVLDKCTVEPQYRGDFLQPLANTLKVLIVPRNNLKTFPDGIKHLRELTILNMAFNELETISMSTLQHLHQLQTIKLQHNQLVSIPSGAFASMPKLKILDLSHNRLQVLSEAAFDRQMLPSMEIAIGNNPWDCSCEISWMIEAVRLEVGGEPGPFKAYEMHNNVIRCASPEKYEGMTFTELVEDTEGFWREC